MNTNLEDAKEAWEKHWDLWITEQPDWGDVNYDVTASVEIFGDSPITFEEQKDGTVMIYRGAELGFDAFCYIYNPVSGDITESDISIRYYRE